MPTFKKDFTGASDFAAIDAAEAWLKAHGFSSGPTQGKSPIGVILGDDIIIAKWRNLSPQDMDDLHGKLEAADFRSGPVTLTIRPDAPEAVFEALDREPEGVS